MRPGENGTVTSTPARRAASSTAAPPQSGAHLVVASLRELDLAALEARLPLVTP